MGVLTEQELANPGSALERVLAAKEEIEVLAEQVKRDGENLYANAKAKCKVELEEISRRELAIAPQEALLRERESKISGREESAGARELLNKQKEDFLKDMSNQLNARDISIQEREVELVNSINKNNIKMQQEASNLKGERLIFEQQQKNATEAAQRELESLLGRESKTSKLEQEVMGKKAALDARELEIASNQSNIQSQLGSKAIVLDQRESELSNRSEAVTSRDSAVEARSVSLTFLESSLSKQKEDQISIQRDLEKSKLDLEIRESKVSKRESLVNKLIENADLKAPGFKENLSKIEEPAP